MTEIMLVNKTDVEYLKLTSKLDEELRKLYGKDQDDYEEFNSTLSLDAVFLAKENGVFVGCGGYKKYEKNVAEIKRVFVSPKHRGKGISKKILTQIEKSARDKGFFKCILETGPKQMRAIGLYEGAGYKRIVNYGQYKKMRWSVCYEKAL